MGRFGRFGELGKWLRWLLVGLCVGIVLVVGLAAFRVWKLRHCDEADIACVRKAYAKHAVRDVSFWSDELAKPLHARIGPAPEALVEYLNLGNRLDGFKERPRPAVLDANFMADLKAAINEIPSDVWRLAAPRLVGFYFVDQLGGTGYTDYVRDSHGNPKQAYVVLDAAVLGSLQANAWATWKEKTPFAWSTQASETLTATIETPEQDNRKNAIQYILLHELAHVISVGRKVHPNWDLPVAQPARGEYPFFDLSWRANGPKTAYETQFDAAWPQRKSVVYYLGGKLQASDMVSTYQALETTNFPTLYAATSPGDDFAESLVSYVHTVRMGKPWNITLRRAGEVAHSIEACWQLERCAQKRKLLETILAGG